MSVTVLWKFSNCKANDGPSTLWLAAQTAPINPGSIPSVGIVTSNANAHRTSVGAGISPISFSQPQVLCPCHRRQMRSCLCHLFLPSVLACLMLSWFLYRSVYKNSLFLYRSVYETLLIYRSVYENCSFIDLFMKTLFLSRCLWKLFLYRHVYENSVLYRSVYENFVPLYTKEFFWHVQSL